MDCMNAQELEWNDLNLVLAICRAGSLSGASRRLGVNHSTVFRRISAIEEKLGVRLFERLPNGYAMTDAGETVFEVSERIENEVQELSRQLMGRDFQLRGSLRVTAPDALVMKILAPYVADFCRTYPDIHLELSTDNQYLNLNYREADVAIRSTDSPPETVVGHRLCLLATAVYGSTVYLNRHPVDTIANYHWIMPNEGLNLLPANRWLKHHYPEAPIVLRSDKLTVLYEMIKQHLGVAPLPCFLADTDTELKRVIDPPKALASELWVLTHPDLRYTARVRAFVEFLMQALEKEKPLIEGKSKPMPKN